MSSGATYFLSRDAWTAESSIDVFARDNRFLASIPIEFMSKGHCASWAYVVEVLNYCVMEPGYLQDDYGSPVELQSEVKRGRYIYEPSQSDNGTPVQLTFRPGPEGKTRFLAPRSSASSSTRSDSRRSSVHQSSFRESLIYRDQDCLLTDVPYDSCTAAHIVPYSRGSELYTAILSSPQPYLFRADMGILVADDLHHAFDKGDWALLPRAEDYIVHVFDTKFRNDRIKLHGRVLPHSRFHGSAENRPNVKLLRWHYQQCVQMHFRGFAHLMDPEAALETVRRQARDSAGEEIHRSYVGVQARSAHDDLVDATTQPEDDSRWAAPGPS